jgi:hypothetical protein
MRTVLIGSDFMYDKNGNLKPIEINTAVGWVIEKLESNDDSLDLTGLVEFVESNGFTKIYYIGSMIPLDEKLRTIYLNSGSAVEYEYIKTTMQSITIPHIEDNDQTLIIRSAYDTTALVDDTYCKNKVEFLELIKDQSFGAQFAYKNDNNELINYITTINDNGVHPNFILKAKLPQYDREVYPKLYKVSNQEELDIVLANMSNDYLLMEYYYNADKLNNDHIAVYRGLNLLFPPNLNSISLGGYTRFTANNANDTIKEYNPTTFELIIDRNSYLTSDGKISIPKILDTDLIQMADGTYKSGLELQEGDYVKTIDIPNPFDVRKSDEIANYQIDFATLQSGTTYSSNKVVAKRRVNKYVTVTNITFTDSTDWQDTKGCFYLSLHNNEVRFLELNNLEIVDTRLMVGDSIILIDTSTDVPTFITKEVASINFTNQFFGGWTITVETEALFLTRAANETDTQFVAIEHNLLDCAVPSYSCYATIDCPKNEYCCGSRGVCTPGCAGNICPYY